MSDKESKQAEDQYQEELFRENLRYRIWMTLLFWSGMICIGLKEWRKASWEDVAGAWSLFGVLTYLYFKWKPPLRKGFPPQAPWWRVFPAYVLSGLMVGVTILRYLGGADDPWMWVVQAMGQWNLEPDRDWLGMALSVILLLTIITREVCFTPTFNQIPTKH